MVKDTPHSISTVDAIRESLEHDIFSNQYLPGTKLTENELAVRYGASRNTVREAVAYLITNGLLVKTSNKGVRVCDITEKDIREIFRLREVLEQEAVTLLGTKGEVSPALLEALAEVEAYEAQGEWERSLQADMRFHELLIQETGSQRLMRLYQSILYEIKMCIFQSYSLVPMRQEKVSQHRQILDAIQLKNVPLAQKLLSVHIEQAVNNYELAFITHKHRLFSTK